MIPERIGPYIIEKKIGAGGMGNVYLGRHETTGQEAAVKELPASLAREEGFVLRFNREIEAIQKLKHPHIVTFFDSGADGDTYYYAMEYVDGETLNQRLRRDKRIPWREAVDIAIQICGALKAAHDAGVIHRDLKPSNLMITPAGQVKLTDFGVAQVFATTKLTVTGGVIGTAEYMSPEQAQGATGDEAQRPVLAGSRSLRDADRPAAVHGKHGRRDHPEAPLRPVRSAEAVCAGASILAGRSRRAALGKGP